jgi:sialate O-acetylesterase
MWVAPEKGESSKSISLAGEWRFAPEIDRTKAEQQKLIFLKANSLTIPLNEYYYRAPTVLFNAMVNPLVPYALQGAIWYQGESNRGRAYEYRKLLPLMIADWRERWKSRDFPFLIVQLANLGKTPQAPRDSEWAELREAQAMTLKKSRNTALAVAVDIGDAKDIHPKNKQDVGARLALAALKLAYGKDIVYSGPTYYSVEFKNGKAVVKFKNTGGGLIARDGSLKQFSIAGKDRKFEWANAEIEGDCVLVWSDAVKEPVAVRYAWADNPDGCNLYNKEGLPAVPFRSDDWDGTTKGKTWLPINNW